MTADDPPTDDFEEEPSDERDPFGRLEDATDGREGDPFEHLAAPDADDGVTSSGDPSEDEGPSDEPGSAPAADQGIGQRADSGPDHGASPDSDREPKREPVQPGQPQIGGADGPSMPDEVGDPATDRSDRDDPFTSPDSAFQRMDVGDLDEDEIWAAIEDAEARGSVVDADDRTYATVSKHRYCESCEHFSPPPEVACAHEDTEILEFPDMDTVRVVDCPIVAERRELERDAGDR